jgi:hypothetical protein
MTLAQDSALRSAAVLRRSEALFKAMGSDFLLREQFVTDPVTIFYEYVHRTKLEPEHAEPTNLLIFAFLSSEALLKWFHSYLSKHLAHPPAQAIYLREWAAAVSTYRADAVVGALLHSAVQGQAVRGFSEEFPFFQLDHGLIARGMIGWDGGVRPIRSAFADTDEDTTTPDPQTGHTDPDPQTGTTDPDPQTGTTDSDPQTGTTHPGSTRPGEENVIFFTGVELWARPLNALTGYARRLAQTGRLGASIT